MDLAPGVQRELATLCELCNAAAGNDGDPNSAAVQRGWRTRIRQIHDLLVHAVAGEDSPNDGIAEPGMVLTIRYDDTGDTETFLLGVRGVEYGLLQSISAWRQAHRHAAQSRALRRSYG